MAPVPGLYTPLAREQRDAVEMLAERSDHGAYVRNNPDDTIELLKVERGAVRRYIVSRTGEATLAESRPRNWRYPCSLCLTWGGALSFVLAIVGGVLVDEDVVSFPRLDDSTLPIQFVVAFLAFGCLVLGDLLTPHPGDYAGPGEWAHIGYVVD